MINYYLSVYCLSVYCLSVYCLSVYYLSVYYLFISVLYNLLMLRFIVAVVMTIIIIKIAEDNPQIATGIMMALYISFTIYSSTLADRPLNSANRQMLLDRHNRQLYYRMVVQADNPKEQDNNSSVDDSSVDDSYVDNSSVDRSTK